MSASRSFAVLMVHGPNWDRGREIRQQDGWDDHARFMDGLVEDGFIYLGGPIDGGQGALHIVEAPDEGSIRARLAEDPWAVAGLLEVGSIHPWRIWLDGRSTGAPL